MPAQLVKIINGGKLVIPDRFRREMGIDAGDMVAVELAEGELRIRPLSSVIEKAQAIVKRFVPEDVDLADELIVERRAAVKRE
jgi:bifunctional DNA-binding transcriptional regulator/antitoxin component of YhaV-PrlF toxin-antitoxin module